MSSVPHSAAYWTNWMTDCSPSQKQDSLHPIHSELNGLGSSLGAPVFSVSNA